MFYKIGEIIFLRALIQLASIGQRWTSETSIFSVHHAAFDM
jgi:hypothetical protein